MSNKEQAKTLLDKIPEYKLGYAVAFLQGLAIDEEDDDLFCESMVQNYIDNSDPNKHETITLEELKTELDI